MSRRTPARRSRGAGLGRFLATMTSVLLLLAVVVPVAVAGRIVQVAGQDQRGQADALLVLGASQLDGEPGEVLLARLEHALALYEQGLAPLVVTTGGKQDGDRFTEAGSAATWLIDHGVPEDAVIALPVGRDTYDSLVPVAELAVESNWASGVLIVTDPWHTYRVRTMAEDLGLPVAGASPTRTGPSNGNQSRNISYVVRETAATLVQHVT